MEQEFHARINELKINEYVVNGNVTRSELLKAGFFRFDYDHYMMRKPLYKYINSKYTYVFLEIGIILSGKNAYMTTHVVCDDGSIYPPFYDKNAHDNKVLDTIVRNYNAIMDNLVKRKILLNRSESFGRDQN